MFDPPRESVRDRSGGKKPSSFYREDSMIGYIKARGANGRRCSRLLKSIECLHESKSRACASRDAISSVVAVTNPLATMTSRDIVTPRVPRSLVRLRLVSARPRSSRLHRNLDELTSRQRRVVTRDRRTCNSASIPGCV